MSARPWVPGPALVSQETPLLPLSFCRVLLSWSWRSSPVRAPCLPGCGMTVLFLSSHSGRCLEASLASSLSLQALPAVPTSRVSCRTRGVERSQGCSQRTCWVSVRGAPQLTHGSVVPPSLPAFVVPSQTLSPHPRPLSRCLARGSVPRRPRVGPGPLPVHGAWQSCRVTGSRELQLGGRRLCASLSIDLG